MSRRVGELSSYRGITCAREGGGRVVASLALSRRRPGLYNLAVVKLPPPPVSSVDLLAEGLSVNAAKTARNRWFSIEKSLRGASGAALSVRQPAVVWRPGCLSSYRSVGFTYTP